MDLQESPHSPAEVAAALVLHLALQTVLEEHLHTLAVLGAAVRVLALARMHQELHRPPELLAALAARGVAARAPTPRVPLLRLCRHGRVGRRRGWDPVLLRVTAIAQVRTA